jgi:CBS domain-containing protein
MGASQLDLLPVVSRANVRQLRGVVTLEDILADYGVGRAAENPPKGRA